MTDQTLFCDYYKDWIDLYKRGAIRPVTYQKYIMTLRKLTEIAPDVTLSELDKRSYQQIINEYAKTHEKQTVLDFHRHLKSAIMDAYDEGLLYSNPARKVTIKGKQEAAKKQKYLNKADLQKFLGVLELPEAPTLDWLILLAAKTGARLSEILALTRRILTLSNRR